MTVTMGRAPDQAEVESVERQRPVVRIPIDTIIVERRIRQDMGDLESLADSIRVSGLLHPVIVDEQRRLLAGERRLRASIRAGLTEIDARIFSGLSDLEKERIELDENGRRKDFHANELARFYVQKKEYVEAALKMLQAEEHRKWLARRKEDREKRKEEREQVEARLRELAAKEEEIEARLREFDTRLGEEEASGENSPLAPSERQLTSQLGISRKQMDTHEAHVAAMDRYRFLDAKEWNQTAALEVAERLDAIRAEGAPVWEAILKLLQWIGDAKRIRLAVALWANSSPEKRVRMGALLTSEDSETRKQIEAHLAQNPLQPDERRVRLVGIIRDLDYCCRTEDGFQARFRQLLEGARALESAIQGLEEENYGWLRQDSSDCDGSDPADRVERRDL
jgi:ParB family chromosome partitioning protein